MAQTESTETPSSETPSSETRRKKPPHLRPAPGRNGDHGTVQGKGRGPSGGTRPSDRRDRARAGRGPARRRTPTVIQMESVECGAAALAMVLGYYGRFVPLEELRTACGVSRDGANALLVLAAARATGSSPRATRWRWSGSRKSRKPAIIFWAFQHFMVLEGIKRRRFGKTTVAVNDPASGPRVDLGGVRLAGSPAWFLPSSRDRSSIAGGHPTSVAEALRAAGSRTGRALPLVLLASLLLVLPGLLAPASARSSSTRSSPAGRPGLSWAPAGRDGRDGGDDLRADVGATALPAADRDADGPGVSWARFFRHLLRLPIEFFLQRQPSEVRAGSRPTTWSPRSFPGTWRRPC